MMAKKVMIVEDSATVRFQVGALLETIGVKMVEAGNEIGMFNMIEEYGECVDLIIMDLTLKHENGFDLIKKLKSSERYMNIPVLVLTEHADREYVLKARNLAVAGYLRKPIQKDKLIERVSTILGIESAKEIHN